MDLTYQQLLAEVYEETSKNALVYQNEYDDEEKEAYDDGEYESNSLPDKEDFNKFQGDRNKPENVITPEPKEHTKYKRPDVRTSVLNIDGAFRGNIVSPTATNITPCGVVQNEAQLTLGSLSSPSYFVFSSHKLYRNVTSVKLTSMEFYNTFYTFSATRGNTSFRINTGSNNYVITIPDGNYSASTIVTAINSGLTGHGITIAYDSVTHNFNFSGTSGSIITFPSSTTNPYGNGIGYNLGFVGTSYTLSSSPLYSEVAPDMIHDTYVYLQINDWNLLEHQQYGQTFFSVFAKIQLTGAKNTVVFDNNYTNSSTKEYIFPQPVNLQRFEIKMLDAYGNILNLRNSSFSMTLELQQVDSSAVYQDLIKTL